MAMTLLTNSADTDSTDLANITFDSGIDSTYKLYIFTFFDINPATDAVSFQVDFLDSSDNSLTKTTTSILTTHGESNTPAEVGYNTGADIASGTGEAQLTEYSIGNGSDESCSGTLWLFNPSNTTYVKNFYSTTNLYESRDRSQATHGAGYVNSTAAVTQAVFSVSSGNFDGTVKLYGVG